MNNINIGDCSNEMAASPLACSTHAFRSFISNSNGNLLMMKDIQQKQRPIQPSKDIEGEKMDSGKTKAICNSYIENKFNIKTK